MKRPVIAIVSPGSYAVPSATSSSVELVIEQVAKRLARDATPVVFGKKEKDRPSVEDLDGVRYVRVRAVTPRSYMKRVSRKLAAYRPQVIQVENRPRFIRYLRRRHPKASLWLVLHSLTFVSRPHIRASELRSCLAAADRIIVNSHFLREEMIRKAPRMMHKMVVNHLGVDTEGFTSRWTEESEHQRQMTLHQMGLAGKKIILYVGRLIKIKGVHNLLLAMPQIVERIPEAVLLVVGSSTYGSNRATPYVKYLWELGSQMPQHVRFIPYVPHTEISRWFHLADVLVVPSNQKEAFGLVNVEAMASGVPVVATRAGGMMEIIEHEMTGFLIDSSIVNRELPQRIHDILTQEGLAQRFGQESLKRVREHFTWDWTAHRLLKLLEQSPKKSKSKKKLK
ncbi:glycosyltransferase family 4 protein [Paenibacillus sp. NPDC056579]|uniref:glycosyltransferase family 4 protein n=1 Tax=Paenibacillus sp. NPDC056579 TaxID=3345871 RepID=UPI0036CD4E4F